MIKESVPTKNGKRLLIEAKDFTFWPENKIDKKMILDGSQLKSRFECWLPTRAKEWLEYYNYDLIIRYFLSDKTGINSTFQMKEIAEINVLLKLVFDDHLKERI